MREWCKIKKINGYFVLIERFVEQETYEFISMSVEINKKRYKQVAQFEQDEKLAEKFYKAVTNKEIQDFLTTCLVEHNTMNLGKTSINPNNVN